MQTADVFDKHVFSMNRKFHLNYVTGFRAQSMGKFSVFHLQMTVKYSPIDRLRRAEINGSKGAREQESEIEQDEEVERFNQTFYCRQDCILIQYFSLELTSVGSIIE